MLFTILGYVGIALLALIGFFTLLFVAMVFLIFHYVQKFIWNMPIMKWVTLKDTVALGVPKMICITILLTLHKKGKLEVRLLHDSFAILVEDEGFTRRTVKYHEFRMTVGPRRKKNKFDIASFMKKFFPDFEPAGTPA